MAGTAFDGNAVTLAEYAVDHNDPLVTKITMSLLKTWTALGDIKFVTDDTMYQKGVRWKDSDVSNFTVKHRALNDVPTVTRAKPSPYMEQAYILSAQIQVDTRQKDRNVIQDPAQMQIDGYMEAWRYRFNDWFINNQQDIAGTDDPLGPVGLKTRLDNPVKYGCALNGAVADLKIDAGVTATTGMSQDNALLFIDAIEKMLDYMGQPNGTGISIYMNDYAKRALKWAVMKLGPSAGWRNDQDAFGRDVEKYKGAQIQDVGRKADQATRIISATENADGTSGSSTYTSIYFVNHGQDTFCGWQWEPLKPKNLGVDPTNGVAINIVIDWPYGLWMPHTRAIGRLYDINLGASPA